MQQWSQRLKRCPSKLSKISRLAKVKKATMKGALERARSFGESCEEIAKVFDAKLQASVKKRFPKRIGLAKLDASDPSHVVVSVRWRGMNPKKVFEEAAFLSRDMSAAVPFAKTLAFRAVNPKIKDASSDKAIWFEATMAAERSDRIDESRIVDFANSRYNRLFDGVQCASALAKDHVLGSRRGPCFNKALRKGTAPKPVVQSKL